jgi:tetratricopeptide (TPR) repeat protein
VLNPNEGNAHHWYGLYLSSVGRHEEALVQFKRAVESDPLNLTFNTNLAVGGYGNLRQYDRALEQFEKTIDIDPNYASAHGALSDVYRDIGKYDLWLQEWKKSATLADDQEDLVMANEAARAYAKGGFRIAISRIVELRKQLAQRRYVDPSYIAYDYAALGDKDQTFYWLEKAYSEKAGGLQYVKVAKQMDPLRSDPRYIDLLKRMGLPQ